MNEILSKQLEVYEAQKTFLTKQYELQILNLDKRILEINSQNVIVE